MSDDTREREAENGGAFSSNSGKNLSRQEAVIDVFITEYRQRNCLYPTPYPQNDDGDELPGRVCNSF